MIFKGTATALITPFTESGVDFDALDKLLDAQVAGEELQRIYREKGALNPAEIVDESRDSAAPLHPCFEWDDVAAAEKYRQTQAQMIVRSIVTVQETPNREPVETRAFVSVRQEYKPIEVVTSSEEQMQELLKTARSGACRKVRK